MAPKPATTKDLAVYLKEGYWYADGEKPHKFSSNTISVSLAGLDSNEVTLAKAAFAAWETVANLKFNYVTSGAKITFDPNYRDSDPTPDATTDAAYANGVTSWAKVKIHSEWLYGNNAASGYGSKIGEYAFHTYMHEIGHALGLGHPSTYPGDNVYANATFQNDSWQQTVMSYLDQDENPNIAAQRAVTVSPMMADIMAIQMLYGAPTTGPTAGNTVYGVGTNLSTYLKGVFGAGDGSLSKNAMTIFDISGTDSIVFSDDTRGQVVNLNGGTFSSVYGKVGNLGIAHGTYIEKYTAGSGHDKVTGSAGGNKIVLGAGNDTAMGGSGDDILAGDAGNDTLWGERGNDVMRGGDGNDVLRGHRGNDTLTGGEGNDNLWGHDGDDMLIGERGSDTFSFSSGRDTIAAFDNDRDTLRFDDALWGGGSRTTKQILAYANTAGSDLVFNFGDGNTLTIRGLTNESLLSDDWVTF